MSDSTNSPNSSIFNRKFSEVSWHIRTSKLDKGERSRERKSFMVSGREDLDRIKRTDKG